MAERLQRYLAIIRLKPDTPAGELAGRIPALHALLSQIANGESEVAFAAPKDNLFGMFFRTIAVSVRDQLDRATEDGDAFLIIEVEECGGHKGMGRAATWLQRH